MAYPFPINTNKSLIYADALSSVWTWWSMVTDPSYALQQEIDLWEILHRDPKTRQGIDQRLNDVAGREWRVQPFGNSGRPSAKLKAAIVAELLKCVPNFASARRRQAQAVFRATSTHLVTGRREWRSFADTPAMHWWVPGHLEHIDPRRFIIKPERTEQPDGTYKIKGVLHMSTIPTYNSRAAEAAGNQLFLGRYVPVKREFLLRTVYDDEESRLGFGRGIMDALYFYHWAKQIVIREGLQGLERWAQGVAIMKINPELHGATDGSQTTDQIVQKALDSLKAMRARHYYAMDAREGEDLTFHTEGQGGANMVLSFLEYIDRCILGVATGASLRSAGDIGAAGGFASDQAGLDLMDTVVAFDREVIGESVKRDLIGTICRLNRKVFETLGQMLGEPGLADEPDPDFVIVQKKRVDPIAAVSRLQQAMLIPGMRVRKAEAYEELAWTMPEMDDDCFEGMAPAAAGAMLGHHDPVTGHFVPGAPQEEPAEEDDEGLFEEGEPEEDEELFGHSDVEDEANKDMDDSNVTVEGLEKQRGKR